MSKNQFVDRECLEKQFNDPESGFYKMRKSAEELAKAMKEFYEAHPDEYEKEMVIVRGIVMRARERAEKDRIMNCGCQYLKDDRCMGQKGMPECTPNCGYCPMKDKLD